MHVRRTPRGFTLVELLVVIGIIALLISILLPALGKARRESLKVKCLAQLKELGSYTLQYANENKGNIPKDYNYDAQYRGDPGTRGAHIFWAESFAHFMDGDKWPLPLTDGNARDPILAPYLAKIKLYSCPAKPFADQPITYASVSWDLNSDDGVTGAPSEAQPMIKLTQQRYAAQVCYITEASQKLPYNSAGCFDHYDIKDYTKIPYDLGVKNAAMTEERLMNDNRHSGFINMLYLDGHAAPKTLEETSRYDFRWISNGQNGR
jgi:prepilin-type N-terminal cleavage/methylation domain-containing protein/prepilin-type processing-associated H-X9-DG protein